MNDVNHEKMIVLVLSDDLNKVLTAFLIAIEAAIKGIDVSMFFMSCGVKALKHKPRLWLKGLLMPVTAIAVKRMEAAGIERLDVQIQKGKDLGVSLYACKMCTDFLGLHEETLTSGVQIVERSRYIDFLSEADHHIEIC